MHDILLGFMTAAWGFTLLGVAYLLWRYVYAPWKVVRADIAALHKELTDVRQEVALRKALYRGDNDIALAESRAAVRRLLSEGV